MRLPKEAYLATQTIYYPGFTIGGFGEGLGLVSTLVWVFMIPRGNPAFPWTWLAFCSLLAMHLVFWDVTQPANRHWVAALRLGGAARASFSAGQAESTQGNTIDDQWERLRNRWEYSHIVRAVLGAVSLISITTAVAVHAT